MPILEVVSARSYRALPAHAAQKQQVAFQIHSTIALISFVWGQMILQLNHAAKTKSSMLLLRVASTYPRALAALQWVSFQIRTAAAGITFVYGPHTMGIFRKYPFDAPEQIKFLAEYTENA